MIRGQVTQRRMQDTLAMLIPACVVGALTALSVLGTPGQAGGATPPAASTVVAPTESASPVGNPGRELVGERTRTSRRYVTADGRSQMTRVFSASVNYRDSSGDWRAIDNGLQLSGGTYRNKANGFIAELPADLAPGSDVSVREGGDELSFSLRGAVAKGRATGARITYPEAFSGVDVSYETQADSLKELITLRSASARREFVFDLALSEGLRPDLLASGALAIRDGAGDVRMSVPAPFMVDADGRISHAVDFAVDRVGSGWRLTLRARDAWLDAPGRAFPVAIDPQVFPNNQADCTLDQALPTTDACALSTLAVGGPAGAEKRAALRFDIAGAVPYGATVTHASMGLHLLSQSAPTQGKLLYLHKLTRQIAAGATWNSPWTTPGGDFEPGVQCEKCPYVGGSAAGGGVQPGNRAYFNMRTVVAGWAKGSLPGGITNNGVLVKTDNIGADGNLLTFASNESGANSPFIDIRFEQRTGLLRGHKYETDRLSDRLSLQVNSASGNLLVRNRDFTVPGGLGPDLTVGHTYNGKHRGQQYAFGDGFSMDTGPDVRLERTPQDDVVFHGPSGYDALYTRNADASYNTPTGFDAKLAAIAPSGWRYTENQSQRKLTFDVLGRLTKDEDRNGRAITYTYVGSTSQLQKITDSQNRDTTFTYTTGRITQITDSGGRLYKYFYDGSGQLTKSTDPENGDTLYAYGSSGLELITTPAGHKTKITYYGAGSYLGRVASVIRVTNPTAPFASMTGPTTQFSYTINAPGAPYPETSVVTDPLNQTVTSQFDAASLPRETRDGLNRLTKGAYTTNSNVMTFTLAGNTGTTPNTTLTYDGATNNLTGSETPATATANCQTTPSSCLTTSASYPAPSSPNVPGDFQPMSTTDAQGKVTNLTYENGNPKTIGQSNSTITLTYATGTPGKLTKITDANIRDTLYGYDAAGNLTTITPPLPLGATTLTYTTAISRVATAKDGLNQTRTLTHDNLDRVTKITYAGGSYVQFVYDKDGNLTARNDSVGGNTTYSYDELSRVLTQTPPGVTTTYTYDLASNLKTVTDPGGTVTYGYDAANQNTSVQEPSVTGAIGLSYDDDGQRTRTSYPNSVSVVQRYDIAGRLAGVFSSRSATPDESNAFQRYSYNYTTPGGVQRALRLDATDQIAGRTTAYDYDGLNRLDLARTYAAGSTPPTGTCTAAPALACYDYTLDNVGNRTALQVRGSTVTALDYAYAYNNANQITTRAGSGGTKTYVHDANGNQTSNGNGRTLAYNLRDQSTSIAGTNATYLGAGQDDLTALGTTTLNNNILGVGKRGTGGVFSYYTRAVDGSLLSQRTGTGTGAPREYYSADALGSITATTTEASGGPTKATYAYDPDGNTTATTGTTTSPFGYAAGYLAPGNLYHYGQRYYDPTDARWTQQDPINQATDLMDANRYVYGSANPISFVDLAGTDVCDTLFGSNCGDTVDKVADVVYKGAEVGVIGSATCLALVVTIPACVYGGAYSAGAGIGACTVQGFRKRRTPRSLFGGRGCRLPSGG